MEPCHLAGKPEAQVGFGGGGAGIEGEIGRQAAAARVGHGEEEDCVLPGRPAGEGKQAGDGLLDAIGIAAEGDAIDEIENDGAAYGRRHGALAAAGGLDQLGDIDLALDEAHGVAIEAEGVVKILDGEVGGAGAGEDGGGMGGAGAGAEVLALGRGEKFGEALERVELGPHLAAEKAAQKIAEFGGGAIINRNAVAGRFALGAANGGRPEHAIAGPAQP